MTMLVAGVMLAPATDLHHRHLRRQRNSMSDVRPIASHQVYGVDEDGKIYKLLPDGSWLKKRPYIGKNGYAWTQLWSKNQGTRRYVHHLVLEAFVGERPHGCEALHCDGDRLNNNLKNLRWGTRQENVSDAIRHGTFKRGSESTSAKLTRHDVLFMRDMLSMGFTQKECSKVFNVSQSSVSRVNIGKTYEYEA